MKPLESSISDEELMERPLINWRALLGFAGAYLLANMILFSAGRQDGPSNREAPLRENVVSTRDYTPLSYNLSSDRGTTETLSYQIAQR